MWLVAVVWLVLGLVFGYLFPYLSYRGAPTGPAAGAGAASAEQVLAEALPANLVPTAIQGFPVFAGALALLLGVLSAGSEYGWGTWETILAQGPGRLAVLAGKLRASAWCCCWWCWRPSRWRRPPAGWSPGSVTAPAVAAAGRARPGSCRRLAGRGHVGVGRDVPRDPGPRHLPGHRPGPGGRWRSRTWRGASPRCWRRSTRSSGGCPRTNAGSLAAAVGVPVQERRAGTGRRPPSTGPGPR